MLGRTEPRIYTPPLRELTPDTSYGFDVIEFAEAIGWPLDPWQQWAVIHLGELNSDGTPRFRFVLILVARQNGKTTLTRVLTLYWMFIDCFPLIFGAHADRAKAKDSWEKVIEMANNISILKDNLPREHVRRTISEEAFWNDLGSVYKFGATNRRAARGDTTNRVILDELREHRTSDTYDAVVHSGNAVMDFQIVAITNQGDSMSLVLESERSAAIEYAETGNGDGTTFIAEWSAPNGADVEDVDALAMANPNFNRRIPEVALRGSAIKAKKAGGKKLNDFKTEVLCQKVTLLDPAIDPTFWTKCVRTEPLNLAVHRRQVALCLDVDPTGQHATLVACVKIGKMYHVEVVKAWHGFACAKGVIADLPELIAKVKPNGFGWFPGGPAAVIAADLRAKPSYRMPWPPRGVKIIELKANDVAPVCMGLVQTIHSLELMHPDDELFNEHVKHTQKLQRGDIWLFQRAGSSPIDATYAMAGALHLVKTLPKALGPVSTGRESEEVK